MKTDNVNHPSHYTQGKIECIDYIEDKDLCYHLGNVVKYVTRAGKKDPEKTIEDLEKAEWYLCRYINKLKNIKEEDKHSASIDTVCLQSECDSRIDPITSDIDEIKAFVDEFASDTIDLFKTTRDCIDMLQDEIDNCATVDSVKKLEEGLKNKINKFKWRKSK